MKVLILTLLLSAPADSLTYEEFRQALLTLEVPQQTTWQNLHTDPAFVPSLVVAGTFATNYVVTQQMLARGQRNFITRPTTYIFISGMVVSLTIYFIQKRRL